MRAAAADTARILERVHAKRLFFTITTGRSGTAYLSSVLRLFRGVHSVHEPKPTFSSALRIVRAAPHVAREFWLEQKLPAIARCRMSTYAETSHVACKGFLESLVDLGIAPELVHLRRDPRAVALSLLSLGTVPGRTLRGVKYYLSPWDPTFLPLDDVERRNPTDYQLCYWYCLEIEERARVYTGRFAPRGVRVHQVELADILNRAGIERLGKQLGLGPLGARGKLFSRRAGRRRINVREEKKRPVELGEAQLSAMESEVEGWVRAVFD